MDPKIAQRYNDSILHEAMGRFGIQENEIQLLDGFESFMYEFYRPGDGEFILRVGHSRRRNPEMIAGEVDWINYLAQGGANVSRAILSTKGNLVEPIDDGEGEQFLATAFIKARGGPSWEAELPPNFTEHYGSVLGRIHRLTKDYVPAQAAWRRPEWDSPGNLELADWLPASETVALQKFQDLMGFFEDLPKDRESYGLIHQDAHAGNFFVHEGQITLFDFDDCVYGWFIYDIAMVFFYELMGHESDPAHIQKFTSAFLRGYSLENKLDPRWLAALPYFLKLREIDLYALIHRSFDLDSLDPWCARYMAGRKEKIENEVPYIEFDWDSLAEFLSLSR
jgi:Ser/Thr protein kinase RdoA (MazF antagonist)